MIRRVDDTSTIYLKSCCFLPDNFTIFRGKAMKFTNEDNSSFVIQCKGSLGIPSFRLEAKGSHVINFPKTGKFQFTSAANATLKCIIEVLEQETKKELPPFLLYGSLGNYADSILAKKKEYENLNQLRKNRVNVTFSPVHNKEEEMEEVNHIRTQRELFKHYKSSVPFTSITNSSLEEENILRAENELTAQQDTGFIFESEHHTVWIEDFDFVDHVITVYVGDTVSFALSSSVPLHAEHIIYGESDNELLKFESDVLQVTDRSRFEFKVTSSGEINVSCKIYHEMHCTIDVKPNTRRLKPLSMDESGITAIALISETSMDSQTHSAHSISSESFYDSDDILSEVEYVDEREVDVDEEDEIDVHHMVSIGDNFHLDQFSEDPDYMRDLDLVDILDAASLEDFIISIDADCFRPDNVDCVANAMVKFILGANYPSCTISCDGEFYGIQLNKYQSIYRHQFQKSGVFEVYNESLNFICCRVKVRRDTAAGEVVSFHKPLEATTPSCINEPGNIYRESNVMKYNLKSIHEKQPEDESQQLRLLGSFFPTKPIHNVPTQIPCSTEEYPTVPLGYDKGVTGLTELTADEQECLQVLQDCLAYDSMKNLSRVTKKRLKYKQRIKLKKSKQSQQKISGDLEDFSVTTDATKSVTNTEANTFFSESITMETISGGKKKRRKSSTNKANNNANHENAWPVIKNNLKEVHNNNMSDKKVSTFPLLPPSNVSLILSSTHLSHTNSGDQYFDSTVVSKRSQSNKYQLYSPDKQCPSTPSSIVSSPLNNARYAFAVADWTEDIEIISDSDESSASTSPSVRKLGTIIEKSAITKDEIILHGNGFEESKNEVIQGFDEFANLIEKPIIFEETASPNKLPCEIASANSLKSNDPLETSCHVIEESNYLSKGNLRVLAMNHDVCKDTFDATGSSSSVSSSSSDSGSLCLIEVEDERWMLTDEDDSDNSDCDDVHPQSNFIVTAETDSAATNKVTDVSLMSATLQTNCVSVSTDMSIVSSKRGLLFSVLGLSNANIGDFDVVHTVDKEVSKVNGFEENIETGVVDDAFEGNKDESESSNMNDDDIVAVTCEDSEETIDVQEDGIAWQRKWQHQQEFLDIFIQRVEEMNRKAKILMKDKLPSGKIVGVYIWEDLPTRPMTIDSGMVRKAALPPGLSSRNAYDIPAVDVVSTVQTSSKPSPVAATLADIVSDTSSASTQTATATQQPMEKVFHVDGNLTDITAENTIIRISNRKEKPSSNATSSVSSAKKQRKPLVTATSGPAEVSVTSPSSLSLTSQPLPSSAEKKKRKKKNHDKRIEFFDLSSANSSLLPSIEVCEVISCTNIKQKTLSSKATTKDIGQPQVERQSKKTGHRGTRRPSLKQRTLLEPPVQSVQNESTFPQRIKSINLKDPTTADSRPICTTVTTTVTAPAMTRMATSVLVTTSPVISLVTTQPSLAPSNKNTAISSSNSSSSNNNNNNSSNISNKPAHSDVLLKNVRKRHEKKKQSSEQKI